VRISTFVDERLNIVLSEGITVLRYRFGDDDGDFGGGAGVGLGFSTFWTGGTLYPPFSIGEPTLLDRRSFPPLVFGIGVLSCVHSRRRPWLSADATNNFRNNHHDRAVRDTVVRESKAYTESARWPCHIATNWANSGALGRCTGEQACAPFQCTYSTV
jgi:hypothetical protein